MAEQPCWSCGGEEETSLFCRFCNSLQRPHADYFSFFSLPLRLQIDEAELQKRFYALSRMLHPDRYTRATPREQQYSLEATSILNDGYRILRDPVLRAEYVLRENGFDIGEQRSKDVPPELLEEVFELNMQLDELRSGDDDAREPLREARERFQGLTRDLDSELQRQFAAYDASPSRETLAAIRGLLNRRRYLSNLVQEVDKALN